MSIRFWQWYNRNEGRLAVVIVAAIVLAMLGLVCSNDAGEWLWPTRKAR